MLVSYVHEPLPRGTLKAEVYLLTQGGCRELVLLQRNLQAPSKVVHISVVSLLTEVNCIAGSILHQIEFRVEKADHVWLESLNVLRALRPRVDAVAALVCVLGSLGNPLSFWRSRRHKEIGSASISSERK